MRVDITQGKDAGVRGSVFWIGPDKYREGQVRCGVKGDDGETYWANAEAVQPEGRAPSSALELNTLPGEHLRADLVVAKGKARTVDDDLVVHGWVELRGTLRCRSLTCIGLEVATGACLRSERVLANVVDASVDSEVMVPKIQARVVNHEQRALAECEVEADLVQHDGHDLNPSWDRVEGPLSLLPRLAYERRRPPLVFFELKMIREALCEGQPLFNGVEPLVSKAPKPCVEPEATDPAVVELEAWFEQHPGTQRELVEDLAPWIERLARLDSAGRTQACKLIRRRLKSPKLKAARDILLEKLS